MYSMTAPARPVCATASIPLLSVSFRLRRWRRQATALIWSRSLKQDSTNPKPTQLLREQDTKDLQQDCCSKTTTMLIVHVHVHVKPESVPAFTEATLANARESVKEPGIARFDVLRKQEDPTHFVLVEAYRTPEAPAAHKETWHYQ